MDLGAIHSVAVAAVSAVGVVPLEASQEDTMAVIMGIEAVFPVLPP